MSASPYSRAAEPRPLARAQRRASRAPRRSARPRRPRRAAARSTGRVKSSCRKIQSRASARSAGSAAQERRLGIALLEVLHDHRGLGQEPARPPRPRARGRSRSSRRSRRAGREVDLDRLVLDVLLGEHDAHARAVRAARCVVEREHHGLHVPSARRSARGARAPAAARRATPPCARSRARAPGRRRSAARRPSGSRRARSTSPGGSGPWYSGTDSVLVDDASRGRRACSARRRRPRPRARARRRRSRTTAPSRAAAARSGRGRRARRATVTQPLWARRPRCAPSARAAAAPCARRARPRSTSSVWTWIEPKVGPVGGASRRRAASTGAASVSSTGAKPQRS